MKDSISTGLASSRTAVLIACLVSSRLHPVAAGFHIAPSPGVILAGIQKKPAARRVATVLNSLRIARNQQIRCCLGQLPKRNLSLLLHSRPAPHQLPVGSATTGDAGLLRGSASPVFPPASLEACRRQCARREPTPALRAARSWTRAPAAHPSPPPSAPVSEPVPGSAAAIA